jgi:hypothetical protein
MENPKKDNLWTSSVDMVMDNLVDFGILFVLFLVISIILILVFGSLGYIFKYASVLLGCVYSFIILWFVYALYSSIDWIKRSKYVDFFDSMETGLKNMLGNTTLLALVLALGIVSGLISLTHIPLNGIIVALYTGIALVGAYDSKNLNFIDVFNRINGKSNYSAVYLYITVAIAVIPVINILQIFLLPVASSIIFNDKAEKQ